MDFAKVQIEGIIGDEMTADDSTGDRIELAPGIHLNKASLRYRFDRSGGPGGQNVNKLNTRATLTVTWKDLAAVLQPWALHRLGQVASHCVTSDRIVISSADSRSQLANRRSCLQKLRRFVIAATARPKLRRRTKPSRGSVQRRLQSKTRHANTKRLRRRPGADP